MDIPHDTPLFSLTYGQWLAIQEEERRKTMAEIASRLSSRRKDDLYALGIDGLARELPCSRWRAKTISSDPRYRRFKCSSGKQAYFNISAIREFENNQNRSLS